jgi:alpha-galactosidase
MAIVTGTLLRSGVKTVGLCHSVQGCARGLLRELGMLPKVKRLQWKIAGINHQAWLLEITDGGRDLYPEIKKRAAASLLNLKRKGGGKKVFDTWQERFFKHGVRWWEDPNCEAHVARDMVRLEMMLQFGYYITESSEHCSEYLPYWIKRTHPELIDRYNIPLDEYPRRCVSQIKGWKKQREEIVGNKQLSHKRGWEYGSYIMEAMETDVPTRIGGNVLNTGLISNLPSKAVVEVACLVDRNGVQPCYHGDLPESCAALNRTNINVQLLTLEAAFTRKREFVYQAAMLDPHTASELSIDEIRNMCDDLIAAHGRMLPAYRK